MAMTSLDERLLVEAHNGGDIDAFASIVTEYSPSLYAHAVMRLGEARAAEDAVQETFLRAYRAMPRFDGEFHLRAWLHRILTNVCFDEGDRRRREIRTLDRMAAFVDPSMPPPDEVIDLDRAFAQQEVATALAALPDAYREALELRYVDQLSFREVADATGVSEENARARVHRGRAALRRLISKPYAFIAFFVPALRKGERAAQAALSSGGADPVTSASSMSTVSTLAQQAPTFTRIAVELSGPMSTKAGIVAGVVAAAATTVAVPVASTVADHTIAPPPAVVAAPAAEVDTAPLPAPQDTTVVVDPVASTPADATAAAGATAGAPTDPAVASAPSADANAPATEQQTFSAPPPASAAPASASASTKAADPVVTPPVGASAPPVAASGPVAFSAPSLDAIVAGGQIAISGAATFGLSHVSGSVQGTLVATPGATADDPVRLDGTLTFSAADGSTQSIRVALRAIATTDVSGATTYAVSAGRYELTDAAGTKSAGSVTGSLAVGPGTAATFTFTLI